MTVPRKRPDITKLVAVHKDLDVCKSCAGMIGPVVHGPAILSNVMLIGQAPGPHEGKFGKPFAWTAGKTMFRWFQQHIGIDEERFRNTVYMAAVARCFPGKTKGGGDRRPDVQEIDACKSFLEREVAILKPNLLIPVGTLAIEQVLGYKAPLAEVVGHSLRIWWFNQKADVICLPHPSGASTWFKKEPGKSLTTGALKLLAEHPEMARIASASS